MTALCLGIDKNELYYFRMPSKKKEFSLNDAFYDHYVAVVKAHDELKKDYEALDKGYNMVKEENAQVFENYKKLNREMMDLKEEFRRAQVGYIEDGSLIVLGAICLVFGLYASWNLYLLYK
jgi:hypothetical protein